MGYLKETHRLSLEGANSLSVVKLAPMCGITDWVFREICSACGCECAYTEMINAAGYLCSPKNPAIRDLLKRGRNEKKLILQLFGREPEKVAEAAGQLSRTGLYDGIDINMGCPAHKIAPSGEGCGLMRTPDTAYRMMAMTVEHSSVPVSVKMRLGWDSGSLNAVQIAELAERAGITDITVHGRTRAQQYSGKADWKAISNVKSAVNIPVTGNGDLFTADEALSHLIQYSTDGVMVARGALGNPWIFRDINTLRQNHTPEPVTLDERSDMLFRHYDMFLQYKPEKVAVMEMRKHIGWYVHGIRGAAGLRNRINTEPSPGEARKILADFFAQARQYTGNHDEVQKEGGSQ